MALIIIDRKDSIARIRVTEKLAKNIANYIFEERLRLKHSKADR